MKSLHTLKRLALLATLALASLSHAAYPDKPVKIVVPFTPGGGNDQLGRMLADKLSRVTGTPFVVDNRAGAGGNLGGELVSRSQPDGYTLLMASNQVVINPSLYPKIGFDVMTDLTPVAMIAEVQFLLVANPSTGLKSVADIIAAEKNAPGKLNHGTPGNGTPQHLAAELFNSTAGTSLTHVPYRGSGPAIADLLGGQIQLAFGTLPSVESYARAGKLTTIASTGKARSSLLPNVPTVAEVGLKNYEASTWYGLLAPAATPKAVLATLSKTLNDVMQDPDFRKQLSSAGFEPLYMAPAAMAELMKTDSMKWQKVVKQTGVKLD